MKQAADDIESGKRPIDRSEATDEMQRSGVRLSQFGEFRKGGAVIPNPSIERTSQGLARHFAPPLMPNVRRHGY